jgi:hypothetical protein
MGYPTSESPKDPQLSQSKVFWSLLGDVESLH